MSDHIFPKLVLLSNLDRHRSESLLDVPVLQNRPHFTLYIYQKRYGRANRPKQPSPCSSTTRRLDPLRCLKTLGTMSSASTTSSVDGRSQRAAPKRFVPRRRVRRVRHLRALLPLTLARAHSWSILVPAGAWQTAPPAAHKSGSRFCVGPGDAVTLENCDLSGEAVFVST